MLRVRHLSALTSAFRARARSLSTLMADDFGIRCRALVIRNLHAAACRCISLCDLCVCHVCGCMTFNCVLLRVLVTRVFNCVCASGSLLRDVGIAREHLELMKRSSLTIQYPSASFTSATSGTVASPCHVVAQASASGVRLLTLLLSIAYSMSASFSFVCILVLALCAKIALCARAPLPPAPASPSRSASFNPITPSRLFLGAASTRPPATASSRLTLMHHPAKYGQPLALL